MIRGKFLGSFMAIFFLSYYLVIFQISFGQDAQGTITQPPSVEAPPFIIARATGPSWTQVNFHVNATSPTSDKISVYCNPGSGSAFPMGSTIVLCAAEDPVTSLVGYAMFNVTVKDTSPPTFKTPRSILKQVDNLQGSKITYDANASDTVDGNTIATCNPPSGSVFPLGLNQVTCTATDKSGNSGEASFSVIVGHKTSNTSSTETGLTTLSQNVTNQLQSPELTVSENVTAEPQSPELTVSENVTAEPQSPELTVSENITAEPRSPELTVSENITAEPRSPELTVSENITAEPRSPELTVSDNITAEPGSPELTVSDNITAEPGSPELTVSDNITAEPGSPELTVSDNITDDGLN